MPDMQEANRLRRGDPVGEFVDVHAIPSGSDVECGPSGTTATIPPIATEPSQQCCSSEAGSILPTYQVQFTTMQRWCRDGCQHEPAVSPAAPSDHRFSALRRGDRTGLLFTAAHGAKPEIFGPSPWTSAFLAGAKLIFFR